MRIASSRPATMVTAMYSPANTPRLPTETDQFSRLNRRW
jgi:hypothetical protein